MPWPEKPGSFVQKKAGESVGPLIQVGENLQLIPQFEQKNYLRHIDGQKPGGSPEQLTFGEDQHRGNKSSSGAKPHAYF